MDYAAETIRVDRAIDRTRAELARTPRWRAMRRSGLRYRLRLHREALASLQALPLINEAQLEQSRLDRAK